MVELEDVHVRYGPDEPWVLRGVDLTLAPGRRIALLGPSGEGKTTLAHLLVRFRDPDAGRVTLAGHDLREYTQDDVRRTVVLAGQDAHLFATTIRENVRLARPEAGEDELVAALRRARVWDWVEALPDGLDTPVGDAGALVSGGERQRIALARAFLSGAPLLVLDEPTAHLDDETAGRLLDDLLDGAGDDGLLLITHSPLRLERFDTVFELVNGRDRAPGRQPDRERDTGSVGAARDGVPAKGPAEVARLRERTRAGGRASPSSPRTSLLTSWTRPGSTTTSPLPAAGRAVSAGDPGGCSASRRASRGSCSRPRSSWSRWWRCTRSG